MDSVWTLHRSTGGRKVAGLCRALADRYHVDPLLVRIAVVVLALSSGIGLILYAAGWLLLPVEGSTTPPIHRLIPATRSFSHTTWLIILGSVLALAVVTLGSNLSIGVWPAVVLALLWYFGVFRPRTATTTQPKPPQGLPNSPTNEFTRQAAEWQRRVDEQYARPSHPGPGAARPAPPPPPRAPWAPAAEFRPRPAPFYAPPTKPTITWATAPARSQVPPAEAAAFFALPDPAGLYAPVVTVAPRTPTSPAARRLGWVTVGVVAAAVFAMVVAADAVPIGVVLSVVLGIVGLALVVSSRVGRPRFLMAAGVLLLAGTLATLPRPAASLGSVVISPSSAAEIQSSYTIGVGSCLLDLSEVTVTENQETHIEGMASDVTVILPTSGNVVVTWHVTNGDVTMPNGFGPSTGKYVRTVESGGPVLSIDVTINGAGDLEVVT